jgi:3-dehydroquinate synthase
MADPRVIDAAIGAARFPVVVGDGVASRIAQWWPTGGDSAFVMYDVAVRHIAEPVMDALAAHGVRVVEARVPSGERSKSFAELERLSRLAATEGIRRSDTVVGIGGGVIGDLAGFVAASYQRGVRLVHVPTTLLAMVDSAIGGKTGIDLPEGKNYVGAIWQPGLVLMDVTALDTLPARELSAGFAEVIKYGLLEGGELEQRIDAWPTLPGDRADVTALILDCVAHKLRVVAEDERENGIRASLNLGHTVGHGIEAAAGYERYLHGEAISLGMLAALRLSESLCGLDPAVRIRSAEVFARHGLPTTLDPAVGTDAILAAMGRDKKADASALNMVLIDRPGGIHLRQNPPMESVVASIEELRA